LPFGAAGAFISASTSISVSLSGSVEGNCSDDGGKLCAEATISQPITLAGGVQVAGDAVDIHLEATASI
jgi:hypothetical protein